MNFEMEFFLSIVHTKTVTSAKCFAVIVFLLKWKFRPFNMGICYLGIFY